MSDDPILESKRFWKKLADLKREKPNTCKYTGLAKGLCFCCDKPEKPKKVK